jgi:hypothetical protein
MKLITNLETILKPEIEQVISETLFICPKCGKTLVSCPGNKASCVNGFMLFCQTEGCGEVYGHTGKKLEDAFEFILSKFPNGQFNPNNKSKTKNKKETLEEILN